MNMKNISSKVLNLTKYFNKRNFFNKSPQPTYAEHTKFVNKHIGPSKTDIQEMLQELNFKSLDELIAAVVPKNVKKVPDFHLEPLTEVEALKLANEYAALNKTFKSYIGQGFYNCHIPNPIVRNVLQNPLWYTPYTPYQAEISQGRLESLFNFQNMITSLTYMQISNCSLLDEATAAAESVTMLVLMNKDKNRTKLYVDSEMHPQNINLIKTRQYFSGNCEVVYCTYEEMLAKVDSDTMGVVLQNPSTFGEVRDLSAMSQLKKEHGFNVSLGVDLLSTVLFKAPGELEFDVAWGTSQRFGTPLGYGGPHAGFLSTKKAFIRNMSGRIIGISKDSNGVDAYRMTLQTREQHIKKDKASSNICTAQALLANTNVMYAIYHGKKGIHDIAREINTKASIFQQTLKNAKCSQINVLTNNIFDTVTFESPKAKEFHNECLKHEINVNLRNDNTISISFDETTTYQDLEQLLTILDSIIPNVLDKTQTPSTAPIPGNLTREVDYLQHAVFNKNTSELDFNRYVFELCKKDYSLMDGMIPLGSCTMKLNADAEMIPITMPKFADVHPYVPQDQSLGYKKVLDELSEYLIKVTGMDGISMQPNSGANGEYAGLLSIAKWHEGNGNQNKRKCLIPSSSHGTNFASARMAGMDVVVIKSNNKGEIDMSDLEKKAKDSDLSCLMVTYPSTHGVYEDSVTKICEIIHHYGGQVYLDGANMNAQLMQTSPGGLGADVCHLNLHKTFCIPHGGGGPGLGPICVKEHLIKHLPQDPRWSNPYDGNLSQGCVNGSMYSSALIALIPWMYIRMVGSQGLDMSSKVAILNANYISKKLTGHFNTKFSQNGLVAHECILDCTPFDHLKIKEKDIAKRLMDYGFHAPTMSWPIGNTLMVEPTESESKQELDRFIHSMISIRKEIDYIEKQNLDLNSNILKNSPHPASTIATEQWDRNYPRKLAVYPFESQISKKYWPNVGRIDDLLGDKTLNCCEWKFD